MRPLVLVELPQLVPWLRHRSHYWIKDATISSRPLKNWPPVVRAGKTREPDTTGLPVIQSADRAGCY